MADSKTPEISDDEQEDEFIPETVLERLMGLSEMLPDKFWNLAGRISRKSYSFVRSGTWIVMTSLSILFLPPLIEIQRVDIEEAQKQQSKQLLFGEGASGQPRSYGGLSIPPPAPTS
jgi:hypothetical protein